MSQSVSLPASKIISADGQDTCIFQRKFLKKAKIQFHLLDKLGLSRKEIREGRFDAERVEFESSGWTVWTYRGAGGGKKKCQSIRGEDFALFLIFSMGMGG